MYFGKQGLTLFQFIVNHYGTETFLNDYVQCSRLMLHCTGKGLSNTLNS